VDSSSCRTHAVVQPSKHDASCANRARDQDLGGRRPQGMSTRRPESQAERAHAFGARIRALRRARKLTQRQVAQHIPMSPGNLSRLENGELGPPSDEVITKLADVLEGDADELFRLAGRDIGGAFFERQVLSELQRLRRDMRTGFDRLDSAITSLREAR